MRKITWNWVGREGKNTTECRLRNSGVKRLSDIGYGEKRPCTRGKCQRVSDAGMRESDIFETRNHQRSERLLGNE